MGEIVQRRKIHFPLLVISAQRPMPGVLDKLLAPWMADAPWYSTEHPIVGYALGGHYRGWLEAVPGGERIITDAPPTSRTMFYGPGVDAVRRRDLRSAERCWSAFQVKHGKQVYRAPQCDVLAPRACVTDADHWKVYEPDADRASGRWVTPFPLAAKMIPAMLDDVQGHYWLSICDITQDRAP